MIFDFIEFKKPNLDIQAPPLEYVTEGGDPDDDETSTRRIKNVINFLKEKLLKEKQ